MQNLSRWAPCGVQLQAALLLSQRWHRLGSETVKVEAFPTTGKVSIMSQNKNLTTAAPKRPTFVPRDQLRVVEPMPPQTVAKELVSLVVTADSVVATATIVFDDAHRRVSVRWGDGTTDVIDIRALRTLSVQGAPDNQSPNTLRVQHAYKPPFDTGSRLITVVTVDDQGATASEPAVVELVRRYRVNLYSVVLEFPHHLDSAFETESEIQASMHASFEGERFFSESWEGGVVTAPQITTGQPNHMAARWQRLPA